MIVAVSLDPAVHVTYDAKLLTPGAHHQVRRVQYRAGGRGLAVARLLHYFGHEVVAAGLAGGTAGELIRAELARRGVPTQFTPIAMESRRLVEVRDESTGDLTTFAEPSPYITTEELGRLAADYRGLMDGASVAVLCGGLPEGLPPEIYGTFATYAAEAGVPVVLDAGGSALGYGAARRPALAIPESVDDLAWADQDQLGDPAGLVARGVGAVATTSAGVVSVLTPDGPWQAWLPRHPRDEPAAGQDHDGAGPRYGSAGPGVWRDALVAGFVPGISLGWSWPDILRHAVSLAATATLAGKVDLPSYERLLPDVVVTAPPGR